MGMETWYGGAIVLLLVLWLAVRGVQNHIKQSARVLYIEQLSAWLTRIDVELGRNEATFELKERARSVRYNDRYATRNWEFLQASFPSENMPQAVVSYMAVHGLLSNDERQRLLTLMTT